MQEEGGGSQYGVPSPEVTPFAAAGMGSRAQLLGMPGASDQLQPPQQQQKLGSFEEQQQPTRTEGADFDALAAPEASEGEFPDEDAAVLTDVAGGEEAERGAVGNGGGGGGGCNRWPREETLALLRIRSEMDAAFRDASLKGPLWEDVSRKLAELGYKRSAKKCKEKFENVHKYYKRTKDGRAGRQDGKCYKFFTQLEALNGHGGGVSVAPAAATIPEAAAIGMVGSAGRLQPTPLNAIPLSVGAVVPPPVAGANSPAVSYPSGGVSFSSNNSFSASVSEQDEDTDQEGHPGERRKRKRGGRDGGGEAGVGVESSGGGGGGGRRKMITFFEGLMRQVMERQEAMQQKLLEMIEKREQDRMIREEAWRRQEMARLTREHEAMAQEREIAASRDATIIAFLQKMTGQTVPKPILPVVAPAYPVAAQPLSQLQQAPPPGNHQPQAQQQQRHSNQRHGNEVVRARPASPQQVVVAPSTEEQEAAGAAGGADPVSSRWPKTEVHALINLRSEMETKYQEAGPKGPLWEEIAAGMRRMGYSRSTKRCKEKWENINKYFKKVKDSSKKRPEDAKTCPYFHQLDALYRKKVLLSAGEGGSLVNNHVAKQESEGSPCPPAAPAPSHLALPQQSHRAEVEAKSNGNGDHMNNGSSSSSSSKPDGNGALTELARHRNGGIAHDEGVSSVDETSKEPEDAMKGPADRQQHAAMDVDYDKMEETESDSMDLQEEDEEEKMEMEYRVEYHQRPGGVNGAASNGAAAVNSFMAMVQ